MIWRWMIAKFVWNEMTKLGQYRRYQSWDILGEYRQGGKEEWKRWFFNFFRKKEVERLDTGEFKIGVGSDVNVNVNVNIY